MTLQVVDGPTIMAGESLSEAIDLAGGSLVRITMPKEWDGGPVTFQVSTDNVGYNDLHLPDGSEVIVFGQAGWGVIFDPAFGTSFQWLKFRSGRTGDPIPQSKQSTFAMTVSTP